MDEVEAALDDVNLTRLINAFNELRAHAQLIIITHQQRTMSIADALYGVTMRADGVTAVVSQKLRTINEWFPLAGTGTTGDRGRSISEEPPSSLASFDSSRQRERGGISAMPCARPVQSAESCRRPS